MIEIQRKETSSHEIFIFMSDLIDKMNIWIRYLHTGVKFEDLFTLLLNLSHMFDMSK